MKTYNKLVRDNIPNMMIKKGLVPKTKILTDHEYIKELNRKLSEEVNEYLEDKTIEELVDIEEVIRNILDYKNTSLEEFEELRKEKVQTKGSFKKRVFLIEEE
jgi:predicted house-cleaning noncanonical NTP pyrophosphatase (MazG superfamily)